MSKMIASDSFFTCRFIICYLFFEMAPPLGAILCFVLRFLCRRTPRHGCIHRAQQRMNWVNNNDKSWNIEQKGRHCVEGPWNECNKNIWCCRECLGEWGEKNNEVEGGFAGRIQVCCEWTRCAVALGGARWCILGLLIMLISNIIFVWRRDVPVGENGHGPPTKTAITCIKHHIPWWMSLFWLHHWNQHHHIPLDTHFQRKWKPDAHRTGSRTSAVNDLATVSWSVGAPERPNVKMCHFV